MHLDNFYKHIGYTFKQPQLLKTALTHRSYSVTHNERLEFLGDSLLNCIIAHVLYQHYPEATEGELSRLRAYLVQEKTLAELARQIQLGSYLHLGLGELKTGGADRESLLADTLEALIAAIFLDSNFEIAQQFILSIFNDKLKSISSINISTKDAKTTLQEYLQSHKRPLPVYEILSTTGEAHQQTFTIRCRVQSLGIETLGTSTNRKKAEQVAAKAFLEKLML